MQFWPLIERDPFKNIIIFCFLMKKSILKNLVPWMLKLPLTSVLKSSLYFLPKFSRVPLTIVLISEINTIVALNFGKRYEDNLRVIFDQWSKLHLGLDIRPEIPILNGLYYACFITV